MATVLVVDDEPDMVELIRVNLESEGHEVLSAHQGDVVMDRVREDRPDIVLLDVNMPGLDGFSVLSEIKAAADVATIPVVMVTGRAATEDRIRGGIEGAVRYLTKPFSADELRREVVAALEGEPEPAKRRRVQAESLEELARLEKGASETADVRPRLTKLERALGDAVDAPLLKGAREKLGDLSPKQRELLAALRTVGSVSDAAARLGVSRSNVYASLRRIGRKLGMRSVPELLALVRAGELDTGEPTAGAQER
jgi:DNA-binding response OmpR family regulator/DNA-binding CsgD family transcriptional regulator